MKTIDKVIKSFKTGLQDIYPETEIQAITELVIEFFSGYSKTHQFLNLEQTIDESQISNIEQVLERLKKHEPVQYILGKCYFYGFILTVSPDVLIPRQETEELVDLIVSDSNNIMNPKILDVGKGSGCIAIALAKNIENSKVFACDVSQAALDIAWQNAETNSTTVHFFIKNILLSAAEEENQEYDIMVSNPPYVLIHEKENMNKNVLNYEPSQALFVDNSDPLLFYKAIVHYANHNLKPQGSLYFEINEAFGAQVVELVENSGYVNVKIIKDINEKDRIVYAKKSIG
jgi:release factor glutamine methyltransferase